MQENIEKVEPPLSGAAWAFIYAFIDCRDVAQAAAIAKLSTYSGHRLYRNPRVYREIQRQRDFEDTEKAKLKARQRMLTVEFLDAQLQETVKELEPGVPKVKALELGYARTGVLVKGAPPEKPPAPAESPQIYRALQTTTLRRVTEEVTQQKEVVGLSPKPKTPALPGEVEIEILPY